MTTTAPVTVSISVQLRERTATGSTLLADVPPVFNGVGSGNQFVLVSGKYQYNLDTHGYQAGTDQNARFYLSKATVVYQSAPSVIVGSEVVQLESR